MRFQFWSQICPPTQFTLDVEATGGGPAIRIGVSAMGTEYPQRSKQGRLGEPSLWADEPTEDVQALLEENARLRGLLVQLSALIRKNVPDPR